MKSRKECNFGQMDEGRVILKNGQLRITIDRLCRQLIENHNDFKDSCIIGLQPRGALFARRLHERLLEMTKEANILLGLLDVTFYRDDFRTRHKPLSPEQTVMDFIVEGKKVILVDDVLFSGRTVRAALTALQHYGRAEKIELVTLIDRHFNRHLPIESDYTGMKVDALDEAYVKVEWKEEHGDDQVLLFPKR